MWSSIQDAVKDLKRGKMIIVVDDEDRENEGDLLMAAEFASPEAINFMMRFGRGLICAPIDSELAEKLELPVMEKQNTEAYRCNFTVSVDLKHKTSTGISAKDRSSTIQALAHKNTKASDFAKPGHVFPLIAKKGGVLVRAGHTEATLDLLQIAGLKNAGVICEIIKDNGEMARRDDLKSFSEEHSLKIITIKDLIAYRQKHEKLVKHEVSTNIETIYGTFNFHVYSNSIDKNEHVALVYGNIKNKKNVLVRAHSECMTGDVFNSTHCDCRNQLNEAMRLVAKKGEGVILYMRQEGRGIGLINKLKAYQLQKEGYDTVEANALLGFGADLRQYGLGAQILKDLGLSSLHLLTNNPQKIVGLEGFGLKVTKRISLEVGSKIQARNYMKTKKEKLGHLLERVY